jgi:CRISPR-associated endonuclease Csn1
MNKEKYYLGLDIGIGSVGWAIIGEANGEHWLEDFGVRLFNVPEESKNKKSLAEKRRGFRGKRRLLNRWHCRRKDLINFYGKIFKDDFNRKLQNFIDNKKPTNLLELEDKCGETKFFNLYVIRYRALERKIELVELLSVLLHISKYRGYKSFYLDDSSESKDEDIKKTKTAVKEVEKLREEFKEKNGRYPYSVAELVVKSEKFRHFNNKNLLGVHNLEPKESVKNKEEIEKNLRSFIFSRESLEEEVQKILEKQSEYYPELKDSFDYALYENGESEKKKASALEIIREIVFRQRDFEDGPGPGDQEKKKQWKANLKEIHHRPIEETRGYCQYFPAEQRGWRCSLIYCLFQFIIAFSEIRINFSSPEKEKEREQRAALHEEVINWLLSDKDEGYKPAEKKKVKTQLKEFLKTRNIAHSTFSKKKKKDIEQDINFKIEFLDYLKTLKLEKGGSFYSALWRSCPSQFYLNYESYKETVFYRIGKIIFENITEKRRKKALNELSQKKYSLESFSNCLTKLEKYDKEKSPASVSFAYMVETIKAFLEGEKYGEFQAKKKEELLKKLGISKGDGKGKLWSPWMHPDLVKNPVVFRSFNQTRKILRNLFLNYPRGFSTINIETGRDLWNSEEERKRIERKNRDKFKEKEEIKKRIEENLGIRQPNETDILKYRLWEDQNEKLWVLKNKKTKSGKWKTYWDRKTSIQETKDGGICLYCGTEINVYELRKEAEKEHIIPQSKWANDSFNNLVLSCKKCNKDKGDRLPFQYLRGEKWESFQARVDKLYQTRNKEKHKFLTLGENWETELEDFISRNLNDTRIIAIRLIEYINKNKKFSETKIQSVKGSATSYFRKKIFDRSSVFHYKDQLRSLTPYHHAIDAIVLAHFKSRGHRQLLEDLAKIDRGKWKLEREYITDEQFNSLSLEIVNKWKRPKWELEKYELFDEYTFPTSPDKKNAIEILEEEIKQKENNNSSITSLITNLKNIVEKRIPVQLEKSEERVDGDEKEGKKIKEIIIEVKGVLSEEEYNERIRSNLEDRKDKKGNIHYPYISYASDHKVKEDFIASEQAGKRANVSKDKSSLLDYIVKCLKNENLQKRISLSDIVEKIGMEKLNSEYGEKYNFLVVGDKKNYTVWDTSKYDAGFGIRNDNKTERIKNIDLLIKKKKGNRKWLIKNYKQVIRPYDVFTLNYPENSKIELVRLNDIPLIYTGTSGPTGTNYYSININVVGLVKDNKENLQIIYPEHGDKIIRVKNKINSLGGEISIEKVSSSIKLLKIDILGKRKK